MRFLITLSGSTIFSAKLNGMPVGETGLNAAVCAEKSIPVALVTGDKAVCQKPKISWERNCLTCASKRTLQQLRQAPPSTFPLLKDARQRAVETLRAGKAPIMNITRLLSRTCTQTYSPM